MNSIRVCSRCVMDSTVPDIVFDSDGVCNCCKEYDAKVEEDLHYNEEGLKSIGEMVEKIKNAGKNKKYDCLIGVSGGVDSTYVAYIVKKKYGLRPLAIHLDNGWDAELAVSNIENALRKLEIDLETIVLDWESFKKLQVAFLKSSVPNAEIPTDHAIVAAMFQTAKRYGIKYIITGSNIVTEAIMPDSWMTPSNDWKMIKAVYNKFNKGKLVSYPHMSILGYIYYVLMLRIKLIPILNYVPYNKANAKEIVLRELAWRDYGAKHWESIYTKFFQTYILPKKFNIDKRKGHLSSLIISGQMTREEAMQELAKPIYEAKKLVEDRMYVIKKLELSEEEFEAIMKAWPKSHTDYPNNERLWKYFSKLIKIIRNQAIKV